MALRQVWLGDVSGDKLGEKTGDNTHKSQNAHGKAHTEGYFFYILILLGELTEEHGLADLDEGGQSENGSDKSHDGDKEEADIAGLHSLLIGGLIDHPFGGKAVEGRHAGNGEGADQEKDSGVGHFL